MLAKFGIVIMLIVAWPSLAGNDPRPFYQRFEDESAVVDDALEQASASHQLVALVLGAEWCHDSRALAEYFNDPALTSVSAAMTLLPIDVGYLENKQSLLSQFGYPAYFATPTLLLIDPQTRQVINRATLPAWQNAHNESATSLHAYLQSQQQFWQTQWQATPPAPVIEAFEAQQAETLYEHYRQLGALLALEDNNQPAPGLNSQWRAVKQYRTALQNDLIRLHEQGGTEDKLPNYSPIAW